MCLTTYKIYVDNRKKFVNCLNLEVYILNTFFSDCFYFKSLSHLSTATSAENKPYYDLNEVKTHVHQQNDHLLPHAHHNYVHLCPHVHHHNSYLLLYFPPFLNHRF